MTITERAIQYIAKMPPAISGSGGHPATFNVAVALCHGFDLKEEEAWPILLQYNTHCEPPWSEKELKHKLAGARQLTRHHQPRGYLRGNVNSTHSQPAKPAKPAKPIRLRVASWQERMAEVVTKPRTHPDSILSTPPVEWVRAPEQPTTPRPVSSPANQLQEDIRPPATSTSSYGLEPEDEFLAMARKYMGYTGV